jgi:hypothetical protein
VRTVRLDCQLNLAKIKKRISPEVIVTDAVVDYDCLALVAS